MSLAFYLPGEADLGRLHALDPDRDWRELMLGERVWVLQTFLRLARAGLDVDLVSEPPAAGILIFHSKHRRLLRQQARRLRDLVLVGIRADNREPLISNFQILQNPVFADGRRRFFMPHWPQPGLVPRDTARGTRIRKLAFKGFTRNVHPELLGAEWREFLAARGLQWDLDAVDFAFQETDVGSSDWADYSDVDLVVAIRPPGRQLHPSKPATKLYNAWHAGVPALLGPETAYRDLRRSPLDYIEVASPEELQAAVTRLIADPQLYRAMIEHGRERAREFTCERILERWIELLTELLPQQVSTPWFQLWHRAPMSWRRLFHYLASLFSLRAIC